MNPGFKLDREFDKIFLVFPLCCLAYPENPIDLIISYCIVEHSKKIETNIKERINNIPKEKIPSGFNGSTAHIKLVLAAEEMHVILGSCNQSIQNHKLLSSHISNHLLKYSNNAYCRIGKALCFEARDGLFPYRQFLVLCGIQSILGNRKKFQRITKDRIRFAMYGYKSKTVALTEMKNEKLLTDRQITTTVEILNSKRLITKFCYAGRQIFFTTRLNHITDLDEATKQLGELIKNSKTYWLKRKEGLLDRKITGEIKSHLRLIKSGKANVS